jgi:uncharacterized membrane protein
MPRTLADRAWPVDSAALTAVCGMTRLVIVMRCGRNTVAARGFGSSGDDFGRLRSSENDRERAVDVLKAAFAEGRLTKDEYDERVSGAYESRTYAELEALTRDLPAGPLGSLPAVGPRSAQVAVPVHQSLNSLAVASLACGVAQWFTLGVTAIPAVVCGHMARRQIRRTGESGGGLAIAGLVLGWIGVTMWILAIIGMAVFATWTTTRTPPAPG